LGNHKLFYFLSVGSEFPDMVYLHLILQSFDWLAPFHLELLQAILFIAV